MKVRTAEKTNKRVLAALEAIRPMQVLVGIPDGMNSRPATYPGGLTNNATLGYLQETGNPSTNLPPRPHLVPGVNAAMPRILRIAQTALRQQVAGDAGALRRSLDMFGLVAVDSVRSKIASNIPPPLSERTIYNRLARRASYIGATPRRRRTMLARWRAQHFTPLIDTGSYINAITYVVRNKP